MKVKLRHPRVYIPNKGFHDFSMAEKFGDLVYITEGNVNKMNTGHMARVASDALKDAEIGDYILISSMSILCSIVCSMFSHKFGRINLLIHDDHGGFYVSKTLVFGLGSQPSKETDNARSGSNGRQGTRSSKGTRPSEGQ